MEVTHLAATCHSFGAPRVYGGCFFCFHCGAEERIQFGSSTLPQAKGDLFTREAWKQLLDLFVKLHSGCEPVVTEPAIPRAGT